MNAIDDMHQWTAILDNSNPLDPIAVMVQTTSGGFVLASEARDAVKAAREQGASEQHLISRAIGYNEGLKDAEDRIRAGVLEYYKVSPKAAEPILRIIDGPKETMVRLSVDGVDMGWFPISLWESIEGQR